MQITSFLRELPRFQEGCNLEPFRNVSKVVSAMLVVLPALAAIFGAIFTGAALLESLYAGAIVLGAMSTLGFAINLLRG